MPARASVSVSVPMGVEGKKWTIQLLWWIQDGASPHQGRIVTDLLRELFGTRVTALNHQVECMAVASTGTGRANAPPEKIFWEKNLMQNSTWGLFHWSESAVNRSITGRWSCLPCPYASYSHLQQSDVYIHDLSFPTLFINSVSQLLNFPIVDLQWERHNAW